LGLTFVPNALWVPQAVPSPVSVSLWCLVCWF
jgi:hypothetical protein